MSVAEMYIQDTDNPNADGTYNFIPWPNTNGAAHVSDAIQLSGNAQSTLSIATTATDTAALSGGVYDVWTDVDCYIKVASVADDVTTSTGYLLKAGNTIPVIIPDQEAIGGIVASGTGTLSYHKVS